MKFNTLNWVQRFNLLPGWDRWRLSFRRHAFSLTSLPRLPWADIQSEARNAVRSDRPGNTPIARQLSAAPASTPAELEEVRCVKYEFLRTGILSTLTKVSFENILLLILFCNRGTKCSTVCDYNIELVSQQRFGTSVLNCCFWASTLALIWKLTENVFC